MNGWVSLEKIQLCDKMVIKNVDRRILGPRIFLVDSFETKHLRDRKSPSHVSQSRIWANKENSWKVYCELCYHRVHSNGQTYSASSLGELIKGKVSNRKKIYRLTLKRLSQPDPSTKLCHGASNPATFAG